MHARHVHRFSLGLRLTALLILVPAPSCVSTAQYRAALAEKERLQRENLELRRNLVEASVRAQEAVEASTGTAMPARLNASAETRALTEAGMVPAAIAPEGFVAPPAAISDEDVRPGGGAQPATAGADGLLKTARSYASTGKPREAIDVYTRLISDFPFSPLLPDAFIERGKARLSLGDRHGALEDFDTVSEAFPASPRAADARHQASLLRH